MVCSTTSPQLWCRKHILHLLHCRLQSRGLRNPFRLVMARLINKRVLRKCFQFGIGRWLGSQRSNPGSIWPQHSEWVLLELRGMSLHTWRRFRLEHCFPQQRHWWFLRRRSDRHWWSLLAKQRRCHFGRRNYQARHHQNTQLVHIVLQGRVLWRCGPQYLLAERQGSLPTRYLSNHSLRGHCRQ